MVDGLGPERPEGAIAGDPRGRLAEDRIWETMDSEVEGRKFKKLLYFDSGLPGIVG